MISIEKALNIFLEASHVAPPKSTKLFLDRALNRVTVKPVIAETDVPRMNKSAVDGYAVRASDTIDASQFNPKILQLIRGNQVKSRQAKQVWTGGSVPQGADSVVMLENSSQSDDRVEVWKTLAIGENISRKGEDLSKGEIAVEAGTRLKPQHLALAATLGLTGLAVSVKPSVAILATGNELAALGSKLKTNQIYESNTHSIAGMCREIGAEPLDLGIAGDNTETIREKLLVGLGADVLVTTGGTSVGVADLVPSVVNKLGKPGILVHGIAMRPAMPTALAVVDGKPLVILPGNPVAAMIGFEVFARPLICRMLGMRRMEPRPMLKARVTRKTATALGRSTFVRVHVRKSASEFYADPISSRGSGMISTMTRANGYVISSENREGLDKGELVVVHLFDVVEGD